MKDKVKIIPVLFLSLVSLVSCKESELVDTIDVPSIYAGGGDIRVLGADFVSPFDTSITGALYYHKKDYSDDEIKDIEDTFKNDLVLYHALSDRHYSYYYKDSEDTLITNIKTINESYGTEEELALHPYLYNLLKTSYEFSLNSNGKFNIFLGTLNDIYETKLDIVREEKNKETLDSVFEYSTNLYFSRFSETEKSEIAETVKTIPQNKTQMEGLLTFDDTKYSVVFHKYQDTEKLSISLGGNAKGFATQYVAQELEKKYPNISFLINSGYSSIKAIGIRPDNNAWKIRYDNPTYYEQALSHENPYYKNEVKIQWEGAFDLSTSGFYNQYFYEYDRNEDTFKRRMHILNPENGYSCSFFDQVSVIMDDSALADLYTTALMNTSSVEEAYSLFESLNQIYQKEDASLLLCYKAKTDSLSQYSYSLSDYDTLSSSHLPIAIFQDGNEYQGDYSSISNSDIKDVKSKFNPSFREVYLLTDNLYSKASLLTEKEIGQTGKTKLAVIEKLSV